jgi:hypothetical protein
MTGRAKWDAWNAAGQKYVDAQEAETRYLQMAKELGWDETKVDPSVNNISEDSNKGKGKTSEEGEGDDDIWDSSEDDDSTTKSNHKREGLGLTVSTMAGAREASEKTLHGFAVDNDVRGLEDLLITVPNLNLNEMDEYVSAKL